MSRIHDLTDAHDYQLALIDPPWSHSCWTGKESRTADAHYATMSLEQLCELPVSDCLASDAVVYLWVVSPMLLIEPARVLEAWGLEYVTVGFNWLKITELGYDRIGPGHHTRPSTELCLLARKGCGLPRQRKDIRQVIRAPVTAHSAKPPAARHRLEQLYGDVRRLEMFARTARDGWDRWGLEAPE